MAATTGSRVVNLENSSFGLAHPDDLQGMTVVDPHLHRVGEVDGLILDELEHRARLLVVASGGIVGLPRTQRLIPVDAVIRVDDQVHIEPSHEHVHQCAEYVSQAEPSLNLEAIYHHYGYSPFWTANRVRTYLRRLP